MNIFSYKKLHVTIFLGIILIGAFFFLAPRTHAEECTITSAKFSPVLSESQRSTFYLESNKPTVTFTVTTTGCAEKKIAVILKEVGGFANQFIKMKDGQSENYIRRFESLPESDGTIKLELTPGEDGCGSVPNPNCQYVFEIHPGGTENRKDSDDISGNEGKFQYNCDDGCQDSTNQWKVISRTNVVQNSINIPAYIGSGECWDETNQSYLPNCYEPISGLRLYDLEKGEGILLDKIDENTTVGDYLNSLFALAIGVAGVLGVIMIVIYAYEYLTSSNPGGKIELRNKILQVLLGIVLLLGIYTILKTINPDLLRLDPFVPEAKETAVGTTAAPETTPIPMVSVGEGSLDVLEYKYFNAEAVLDKKTNEVVFIIRAMFRDGITKPTQGLEVHIGTSETDLPLVFQMEDIAGDTPDIIFFGLNQTKSLATDEQAPTTYYYKIIDVASGDQVKTSEETVASESCTPLEPTNQTPGTQQEASNKKMYNPKRSEADFIEWVNNCRSSISGLEPKKLNLKNDPTQTIDILPCDSDNLVTVSNVFGGKSFQTHKNLKPAIERISQKWDLLSGADKYEIKEIGGNHCRWMTDREGQVLSNHSYALAIDINPKTNDYMPNYKDPGLTRPRSDYTDMPQAFVQLWKDEGFGWGGDWETKKDAMHFSKMKGGELGNGIVDAI